MFSLSNRALNSVCLTALTESVGLHCQKSVDDSALFQAESKGDPSISILSSVYFTVNSWEKIKLEYTE